MCDNLLPLLLGRLTLHAVISDVGERSAQRGERVQEESKRTGATHVPVPRARDTNLRPQAGKGQALTGGGRRIPRCVCLLASVFSDSLSVSGREALMWLRLAFSLRESACVT